MPRIPQGPAQKGSQKWIQKVINENPELINSRIRTQLDLPIINLGSDHGNQLRLKPKT